MSNSLVGGLHFLGEVPAKGAQWTPSPPLTPGIVLPSVHTLAFASEEDRKFGAVLSADCEPLLQLQQEMVVILLRWRLSSRRRVSWRRSGRCWMALEDAFMMRNVESCEIGSRDVMALECTSNTSRRSRWDKSVSR
jgi:hypothetical protein